MTIYKEWRGKNGLNARFYSCKYGDVIYFYLDLNQGRKTTELKVEQIGVSADKRPLVRVSGVEFDIPKQYADEIASMFKAGLVS